MSKNYDILIASSINMLNSSIVASLKVLSATAPPQLASPPASMQSNISDQPRQDSSSPSRSQQGLTLVELMIAMLLGLFLLAAYCRFLSAAGRLTACRKAYPDCRKMAVLPLIFWHGIYALPVMWVVATVDLFLSISSLA